MSSQTKPATPQILTKLHYDILLYLCDFLDAASLLNFSLTCKMYHQLINENESYWRLRYYKEFLPDEDGREGGWLASYCIPPEPKQPTSQPKTLEQKATRDWSHINWRKAYYRRHMIGRNLINGTWCERYCDLPVDPETASLCIIGMNARTTLIGEIDGTRLWTVRDSVISLGVEPEQLTWKEVPLSTDTIGKVVSIFDVYMTSHYIIMWCDIHFPEKFDDDDDDDDQPSLEDIYKRKAIIAWDAKDINRIIPIYIQKDDEVRNNIPLPVFVCTCPPWALGFTHPVSDSQSNDTRSYRYFIYNFDQASYHHFDPIYTDSDAHVQSASKDYIQVIILHFDSNNMEVGGKSFVIANGKPASLRIQWHSYIFDDKHSAGLEDHSGEIIMPYCDNPGIYGLAHGPGLMMVMIYNTRGPETRSDGTEPPVILALVRVPDHSLPQNNISRHRRSRRAGTIGEVIWIQSIATTDVRSLYSQNLIVVKQGSRFDILSDIDGKRVRQFDVGAPCIIKTIIGPYCYLQDHNYNSFIINMETKEIFQHNAKLQSLKKRQRHTVTPAEDAQNPPPTEQPNGLPFIPNCWPFYHCIGQLGINEPGHRNRFYLYSLPDI
jgi:hypothetical protein